MGRATLLEHRFGRATLLGHRMGRAMLFGHSFGQAALLQQRFGRATLLKNKLGFNSSMGLAKQQLWHELVEQHCSGRDLGELRCSGTDWAAARVWVWPSNTARGIDWAKQCCLVTDLAEQCCSCTDWAAVAVWVGHGLAEQHCFGIGLVEQRYSDTERTEQHCSVVSLVEQHSLGTSLGRATTWTWIGRATLLSHRFDRATPLGHKLGRAMLIRHRFGQATLLKHILGRSSGIRTPRAVLVGVDNRKPGVARRHLHCGFQMRSFVSEDREAIVWLSVRGVISDMSDKITELRDQIVKVKVESALEVVVAVEQRTTDLEAEVAWTKLELEESQ
ncbi:hypothetical protein GW17_00055129 [Ensete ventricosum]|uniref:Uncharacterized protein n=1 Tax=Ensete ventricosum TaxID=4639 RepID=A0A444CBL8_ENSVE|nr:hypothetical protein GW17_00055129 [Ensete ventricosum]RZR70791.1 hypothetical protein BHM03_00001513 [Ensete ventricosum]